MFCFLNVGYVVIILLQELRHDSICLHKEGGVRVCGDAVVLDFWCGFAVIFILSCGIAVLQNQAVCGI